MTWKRIGVIAALGSIVGLVLFVLVHWTMPGFRASDPAGVIVDRYPLPTLAAAVSSPFSACVMGVTAFLAALGLRIRSDSFFYRTVCCMLIIAVAVAVNAGIQLQYDHQHPWADSYGWGGTVSR